MREFLIFEGQEQLSFVSSAQLDEQTELLSERIRRSLDFSDDWAAKQRTWTDALRVLREAMEMMGILVVVNGIVRNNTHRKLDPSEFRGFVLVDEYAPLVFVNGADSKAAQMFTLAHELVHVFYGRSAAFDLRRMQPAREPTEQACNLVAAEFLVPKNELRKTWNSIKNEPEPYQAIARQFKVSVLVAARRALDLSLINKTEFFEFYHEYLNDERRKSSRKKKSGGDPDKNAELRVGKRFASAVIQATREGKLLYSEAYSLTDLYGKTFERYASYLTGGGRSNE
jgi:Zn-dependent peptidase ImmA (M78 family)